MSEQTKKLSSLSVFFPCHNEEGNIHRLVESALQVLPDLADDFEIIVVNDGSAEPNLVSVLETWLKRAS
jgi:cellulose synthase/poly-beta-1,6-N-acetylglucosamine synthase-like glycosyltransferase